MTSNRFDTRKREGKMCMTCGGPRASVPVQFRHTTFWVHVTCQQDNDARAAGLPVKLRPARPARRRTFRPDPNLPDGFVGLGELGELGPIEEK